MNNDFEKLLLEKYITKDNLPDALEKLNQGYPVQYIIGNVDFMDLTINVNENVLIPRFETEYLVDDLIKLIQKYNFKNPEILDIGTGSGCIAIALNKKINSNVSALDISNNALDVAIKNSEINKTNIKFFQMDILKEKPKLKYDVIVSNPPYVPFESEVDEKIKFEPQNAIYAEDDGLSFYKRILSIANDILNKRSIIAFEIGINQGKELELLAKKYFPCSKIILKQDLNNIDRYFYIINE